MLRSLKLLLPALIPSWNFFDSVGPSPRIEFALLQDPDGAPRIWREFRPRPANLSVAEMFGRLVWNARWNETLFLMSCAERLTDTPNEHGEREIFRRIQAELKRTPVDETPGQWLQFRLAFVARQNQQIIRDVLFVSPVRRRTDL